MEYLSLFSVPGCAGDDGDFSICIGALIALLSPLGGLALFDFPNLRLDLCPLIVVER
jgi:hypothetical protein